MIRKATPNDLDGICDIYDAILRREERSGQSVTNWKRDLYPTRDTARKAGKAGTLYVDVQGGEVAACANLNQIQPAEYAGIPWSIPAKKSEVLVIHTLVVHPVIARHGLGRKFVAFAEGLAKGRGCKAIRLDTYEGNAPARGLYEKYGFRPIARRKHYYDHPVENAIVMAWGGEEQ